MYWQYYGKFCSLLRFSGCFNGAMVPFDDLFAKGQSESRAFVAVAGV